AAPKGSPGGSSSSTTRPRRSSRSPATSAPRTTSPGGSASGAPERAQKRIRRALDESHEPRDDRAAKLDDDDSARGPDDDAGEHVGRIVRPDENPSHGDQSGGGQEEAADDPVEHEDGD